MKMCEKLYTVISRILGVSVKTLNEESSQDTVEYWDSFKHMNLILAIEEEFKLTFSDPEIMSIKKIKDISNLLQEKGIFENES